MTTDGINGTDVQAAGQSSWYVALAQLPGLPLKLQLAVMAGVTAAVQQMPVSSYRNHRWAGAPRAPAKASEGGNGSVLVAGEFSDLAEPEDQGTDASMEAEKMEPGFWAGEFLDVAEPEDQVPDASIEAEKMESAFLDGEFSDVAEPEDQVPDASIDAEKMESAFLAGCMSGSRLAGETRT